MTSLKDRAFRVVTALHIGLYRATGGRIGGRLGRVPILLLTTRGRRTGRWRTVPLVYVEDGPRLVLVASFGGDPRHPQWYANLRAHPEVRVTQGRHGRTMMARTATPAEKEILWPRVVSAYQGYEKYQRRTEREIPLVILSDSSVE